MQTQEKFSIAFIKQLSQEKKTFLFRALIKRQILTSRKVFYTKLKQSLFCRKDAFQNTGFSRLKCQLNRKKIDTTCFS